MTLTIDLPPDLESAVKAEAVSQGVEPSDIAFQAMVIYLAIKKFPLPTRAELNKPAALVEWATLLHDQGKTNKSLQLTIDERLQAIRELTQTAQAIIPKTATTNDWSREEIYEGETERILGIGKDRN